MLASLLALMGMLGGLAALASEMPALLAVPLSVLSLGHGVALARREAKRAPSLLVVGRGVAWLDGRRIGELTLDWRGPLAFLRFREGNGPWRRLVWWPDTLEVRSRRELRLAIPVQATAQSTRSMAS